MDEQKLMLTKETDLSSEFILAGKHFFVQGRQNGSFSDKWDGFWIPPVKLADSYQIGVGEQDLGFEWMKFCRKFIAYPSHVEHYFSSIHHDLEVFTKTFVPIDVEGAIIYVRLKNVGDLPKDLKLFFAVQADLRPREQDTNPRKYDVYYDSTNGVIITKLGEKNWLCGFGSNRRPSNCCLGDFRDEYCRNGGFKGDSARKISNAPGRSCLQYDLSINPEETKELTFAITGSLISEKNVIDNFVRLTSEDKHLFHIKIKRCRFLMYESVNIETPIKNLDIAFEWSKQVLDMLKHEHNNIGFGYFAGLPWFTMYWGRDSGILLQAVDDYGDFDSVREALFTLAKYQSESQSQTCGYKSYPGEIPNEIRMDGKIVYYSADATPLFIIASHHHLKWTWERAFLEAIFPKIIKAVEWGYRADEDSDSLIEHYGDEYSSATWMDTYNRAKKAIEVQSFWCKALECAAEMAEMKNELGKAQKWRITASEVKKKLNELYWNAEKNYAYDTIRPDGKGDESVTVNPIVPVIYGQFSDEKAKAILERIGSWEFTTPWGVRTRSVLDPEYDGCSYHKGNVWGLTTGLTAFAEIANDQPDVGIKYLIFLADLIKIRCLGAIPEVLSGDTPTPLMSPVQAWSSSVLIQGIIEYLFGINPYLIGNHLLIDPCLPSKWKFAKIRNLKVGNVKIDFSITKIENRIIYNITSNGEISAKVGFRLDENKKILKVVRNSVEIPVDQENLKFVKGKRAFHVYIDIKIKPHATNTLELQFSNCEKPFDFI
jgi:glycogen debranching enzyme